MTSLTYDDLGSAAQRDRRRRILAAALALASEGGYDAVQMRAVADQADVALGTLYRYFPSKVHLLVSALAQEFARADASFAGTVIPGSTPADRVMHVLGRITQGMQRDPHLTEALTRAFMFADSTAASEIRTTGTFLVAMLTRAMKGRDLAQGEEPSTEEAAIAGVVGDVWLAGMVAWVTGRASADDVAASMDVAVRLLLR